MRKPFELQMLEEQRLRKEGGIFLCELSARATVGGVMKSNKFWTELGVLEEQEGGTAHVLQHCSFRFKTENADGNRIECCIKY